MFKDLYKGFQVFGLDKSQRLPRYVAGTVVSVSIPRPKNAQPMPMPFGAPQQDRVVDLVIDFDGKQTSYEVPETSSVASTQTFTLACSIEVVANEISAIKRNSEAILSSIDGHKEVVSACDEILGGISPVFASNKEQEERIASMEKSIGELTQMNQKMLELLKAQKQTKPTN